MLLLSIIISCFLISLCAFLAVFFLFFKKETISQITIFLVSLSSGALMGGAFIHLLPEASKSMNSENVFLIVLISFATFFFIEKLFHWRHCHKENCKVHTFGYMNLFGNSLHNLIDGLIIASAFFVDSKLGIITSLAIALHEIPQEIGDFGVLVHAGFNKARALILNYVVANMVILGGIIGYLASSYNQIIVPYLLPIAAGGFIYISASDLIPEIRQEKDQKKSITSFILFLFGIILMFAFKFLG